jgi:hypothetical protein
MTNAAGIRRGLLAHDGSSSLDDVSANGCDDSSRRRKRASDCTLDVALSTAEGRRE